MSPETAPIRHHKVNATKEESRKTRVSHCPNLITCISLSLSLSLSLFIVQKQFLQQLGLKSSDADIIEVSSLTTFPVGIIYFSLLVFCLCG